eukprot:GHVP01053695.1.p1 GENE.GHVP01053695.1~~GHVP01053695.1.p1  ORF type:complete len:307 (-),score=51.03 GHVP01053695.1:368-1288(-)
MDADGILGMARRNSAVSTVDSFSFPSVIQSFEKSCGGNFTFFKIFLSSIESRDQSYVSFGNDSDLKTKENSIQWAKIPLIKNRQWLVNVVDVRWSDDDSKKEDIGNLDEEPYLVDSGTSLILVKEKIFHYLYGKLLDKGICVSLTMCRCSTSIDEESKFLPDISFFVEAENSAFDEPLILSLKPRHFLIPLSNSADNCVFAINSISKASEKSWKGILGMPLIRAYPTTFNVKTAGIGFEKNFSLPPFNWHHKNDQLISFYAFLLGSGLGLIAVSLFVFKRYRQQRDIGGHEHGLLSRSNVELQEAP